MNDKITLINSFVYFISIKWVISTQKLNTRFIITFYNYYLRNLDDIM